MKQSRVGVRSAGVVNARTGSGDCDRIVILGEGSWSDTPFGDVRRIPDLTKGNSAVSVRRKRGRSKAGHGRPFRGRALIAVTALLALLVAGCGGSESGSSSTEASGSQSASSTVKYAGTAAVPSKAAPPLVLRDSLGHPVNLDQSRGKAVLVTFIYDHCPDICPLIVGNLHTAQAQLGPEAQKLQIIAVSVDPRGDTPSTVKDFLREHRIPAAWST